MAQFQGQFAHELRGRNPNRRHTELRGPALLPSDKDAKIAVSVRRCGFLHSPNAKNAADTPGLPPHRTAGRASAASDNGHSLGGAPGLPPLHAARRSTFATVCASHMKFTVSRLAMAFASGELVAFATIPASAATIDWTQWGSFTTGNASSSPGAASGVAGSVSVGYAGEIENLFLGYPSWQPSSTFSGGTVGNPPPSSGGILQLFGGQYGLTDTVTFSRPVTDPVMAIWSLGQDGINASFQFAEPFSIESGGPSLEYSGSTITALGNTVYGAEGNGTIQFHGTYSQISWTNPTFENWYGFTVGVSAVPEPATWAMMLLGFGALGFAGYRRSRKGVALPMAAAA
jgi:PEP-CTERM motif